MDDEWESGEFDPDWVSPPGHTLRDLLAARDLTVTDLSEVINRSEQDTRDLLEGTLELTYDMAERLAAAFGTSTTFWVRREAHYRKGLAKGKRIP